MGWEGLAGARGNEQMNGIQTTGGQEGKEGASNNIPTGMERAREFFLGGRGGILCLRLRLPVSFCFDTK